MSGKELLCTFPEKMKNPILNLILWCGCSVNLMLSCSLVELSDSSGDDGFWESPIPYKGTICAVGVEYPEGYDWHKDREYGTVPCSLFVWANGHKTMKLAVGNEHEVSADPDQFRLLNGDLYTDFSTRSETVVKKNGKTLFRYSGREMMASFVLVGNDIYTLGNSREGRGFSLRKNGKPLYSRGSGTAFGHLEVDSKGYGFCFYEGSLKVGEGKLYTCMDGNVELMDLAPKNVTVIYDAAVSGNQIVCLGGLYSWAVPVLVIGNDVRVIENAYQYHTQVLAGGELSFEGEDIYVSGLTDSGDTVIWRNTDIEVKHMTGGRLCGLMIYGGFCIGVAVPGKNGGRYRLVKHDRLIDLPSDYAVSGFTPACLWQGDAYVAMSSRETGKPIIWSEKTTDTLDVNGRLYAVHLVK